ncbi:hypothetical protein ACS0TY_005717 [Phlomoides rotata]
MADLSHANNRVTNPAYSSLILSGKFCGQGVALLEDCVQKMYQNSGARTRLIDYIASPQQSGEDGDISFHAFNDNAVLHQVIIEGIAAEKPKPPNTRLVSFQMKQSCTRRISNAINAWTKRIWTLVHCIMDKTYQMV